MVALLHQPQRLADECLLPLLRVRTEETLIQTAAKLVVVSAATAPHLLDELLIAFPLLLVHFAEYAVNLSRDIRLVANEAVRNGSHRSGDLDHSGHWVFEIPENFLAVLEGPVVFALVCTGKDYHAVTCLLDACPIRVLPR